MNLRNVVNFVCLCLAFGTLTPFVLAGQTRLHPSKLSPSKSTDYTVYATPYVAPDFATQPVSVVSITSDIMDAKRDWAITQIQLLGRREGLRSVTITCYVSPASDPGKVIRSWDYPEIKLSQASKANDLVNVDSEFLTHRDLVQVRTNDVNVFQVDVAVTRATFDNGEVWKAEPTAHLKYLTPTNPTASDSPFLSVAARAAFACPHTKCNFNSTTMRYFCDSNGTAPTMCNLGPGALSCSTSTCP